MATRITHMGADITHVPFDGVVFPANTTFGVANRWVVYANTGANAYMNGVNADHAIAFRFATSADHGDVVAQTVPVGVLDGDVVGAVRTAMNYACGV